MLYLFRWIIREGKCYGCEIEDHELLILIVENIKTKCNACESVKGGGMEP